QAGTALNHGVGADILGHRTHEAEKVDAVMLEEAAILGCENRLDDVIGHLVHRHRIALYEAALADLVAIAIKEGDGEIVLRAPVASRFLKGRDGKGQHDDCTARAQRETLAQNFDDAAPPALDAEAAEENGRGFPEFAEPEADFIKGGVKPGVYRQQEGGDTATFLLRRSEERRAERA